MMLLLLRLAVLLLPPLPPLLQPLLLLLLSVPYRGRRWFRHPYSTGSETGSDAGVFSDIAFEPGTGPLRRAASPSRRVPASPVAPSSPPVSYTHLTLPTKA